MCSYHDAFMMSDNNFLGIDALFPPCGFLDQTQDIRLVSNGFYPFSLFVRIHGNY